MSQLFSPGVFEDDDVTHVEGEVNPVRDIEIISEELRLKVSITEKELGTRILDAAFGVLCRQFRTVI
mgnify:CR=1 FL=1